MIDMEEVKIPSSHIFQRSGVVIAHWAVVNDRGPTAAATMAPSNRKIPQRMCIALSLDQVRN